MHFPACLAWSRVEADCTIYYKGTTNYQVEVEMEVVGKSCPQQNRKAIR